MRLLIVVPGEVRVDLGGAQIAVRLAEALRNLGHDVKLQGTSDWARVGSWRYSGGHEARGLRQLLREETDWDVVDAPSRLIPDLSGARPFLVARDVQPELDYLRSERRDDERRQISAPRRMLHAVNRWKAARAVECGWLAADRILCLGKANCVRFARQWPRHAEKALAYRVAPSSGDRDALREVARERMPNLRPLSSARLLWIGRWCAHKGIEELTRFAQRFLVNSEIGKLTLAGTGSDPRCDLPREISRCERLRVVPAFDRKELLELLRSHDAGLFTSTIEGWGLSLQEMLESGIPVYAREAGAAAELGEWFPTLLRGFPPSLDEMVGGDAASEPLGGYEEVFSWSRIAIDYLSMLRAHDLRVKAME